MIGGSTQDVYPSFVVVPALLPKPNLILGFSP